MPNSIATVNRVLGKNQTVPARVFESEWKNATDAAQIRRRESIARFFFAIAKIEKRTPISIAEEKRSLE